MRTLLEGGQILASELVRAMAGRRAPSFLRPLGPIQLKGLSEPLEAFVVEWTPLEEVKESQPVVPLPARSLPQAGRRCYRTLDRSRVADRRVQAALGRRGP